MIIGLTGMYCAGKNLVGSILEKRGLAVLDVDKLGHIAIENQKTAIFARFGESVKNGDGSVNRQLLGKKVFGKKEELAALEGIVHPEANRLTIEWIEAENRKNCVINAAVLHGSVVFRQLDSIILVNAPLFVRLIRAKKRDKLPWVVIFKRFSSQRHFFAHYLAGNADIHRVENPGFGGRRLLTGLEEQIDEILLKLGVENSNIEQGGF